MRQYHDLMERILADGVEKHDRTGTGTRSVFGHQMRFDLGDGFPLTTTKKLHVKSIVHELLWFLAGDTNIKYLKDNGVRIWDEWADEHGDLGPVYGRQWRSWPAQDGRTIDQISNVVDMIRRSPDSRRLIVTAWNPADVDKMALPPCHCLFQFYVAKGRLSCQLYQRSADGFLGVPFNIASYALLTMMVAQVTGLAPGEFVHTLGDAHLYLNHLEQARLQLARPPRRLPRMVLNPAVTAARGDALRRAADAVAVIGGADLYEHTIASADRLVITRVHLRPAGDTMFPVIDRSLWKEVERREHDPGPGDAAGFTLLVYE